MRRSPLLTTTMATTPVPVPPMRARSDDQEPLPSPKKLKSELAVENPPRRAPLRDVTNELRGTGASRSADAKKQLANKPRVVVASTVDLVAQVDVEDDVSVVSVAADWLLEEEEEARPEVADDAVVSPSEATATSPPCATEDELLAFEHLMGQAEEDELAVILYQRLREQQLRHRVEVNYFEEEVQPHLNAKMRSILVDWLIDIHHRLKLHAETLFLAINYLDRYLAEAVTTRSELQLVGLTCLFIAAKFEEVEPADLDDLTYVTGKTFTGDQIVAMERKIIAVLGFHFSVATAQAFVDFFTHNLQSDRTVSVLAAYFTQSMLYHLPLVVCYPPAERAAAAVFMAQCVTGCERPDDEWILQWESLATTSYDDLLPCLQDLCTIMAHPSKKLAALRTKFGTKRFGRVANKPMDSLDKFL